VYAQKVSRKIAASRLSWTWNVVERTAYI